MMAAYVAFSILDYNDRQTPLFRRRKGEGNLRDDFQKDTKAVCEGRSDCEAADRAAWQSGRDRFDGSLSLLEGSRFHQ
jgi:hypothetical protein